MHLGMGLDRVYRRGVGVVVTELNHYPRIEFASELRVLPHILNNHLRALSR